jgi:tetratricopeptide (TPR) repeat protein
MAHHFDAAATGNGTAPMSMADVEEIADAEDRAPSGDPWKAFVAVWATGIRDWQQDVNVRRRRKQLHADAQAAARGEETRVESAKAAERSRRLLEGMDEMVRAEREEALQQQRAASRSGLSFAVSSGEFIADDDGGDVDGSFRVDSKPPSFRVPRPPSAGARRSSLGDSPVSLSLSARGASTAPTVPLTKPTDVEPVFSEWLPPHAVADATQARVKHGGGDFAGAMKQWNLVLKECAGMPKASSTGLAVILSNRAATLMAAGCHEAAASDCSTALELCSSHALSNVRLARCHMILGQHARAKQLLTSVPRSRWPFDLSGDIAAADTLTQYGMYLDHGNYGAALDAITRVSNSVAGGDVAFDVMRLEVLGIVAPEDALEEAIAASEQHSKSAELRYWRSLYTFRNDPKGALATEALRHMQDAEQLCSSMLLAPYSKRDGIATSCIPVVPRRLNDIRRAKVALTAIVPLMSTIESALRGSRWAQGIQACNGAMQADLLGHRKLRAYVLLCRARALLAQFAAAQAASDCTDALLVVDSPFLADLHSVRSEAYSAMCDWARALSDAREAYRLNPCSAAFERVERARTAAEHEAHAAAHPPRNESTHASSTRGAAPRQHTAGVGGSAASGSTARRAPSTPPTHYEILKVPRGADRKTIARAYRDAALVWHPDRWSGKPAAERLEAEEKFKRIGNAYSVLTEPAARAAYDRSLPSL